MKYECIKRYTFDFNFTGQLRNYAMLENARRAVQDAQRDLREAPGTDARRQLTLARRELAGAAQAEITRRFAKPGASYGDMLRAARAEDPALADAYDGVAP